MKKVLMALINVYRKYISPLKRPTCRFTPTCSQYALDSITKYGTIKGLYLATKRILKCHPFNSGGYDPIK